ncbi:Zn-dependent hydrolase [Pseudomonadota bacterium]|nr:Zn-dependent hydrolase [Alphaproteobacteria bacterium]MDC1357373.1 Zn-dependent hydrolase [Pseudomonadota bacterium]|tara:strand:+ start:70 stop:1308 length:1239 start_codon:yes stop_codon:yes gene_type:complete
MIKETNISINQNRLWDSLMTIAKIGPGIAGGNNRQTVTEEDGEARKLFQKWSEEAGMKMIVDELGSMFFRREGTSKDALPVVIGSHLDTQPTGGKYDGVLGVLAGLEIVRTLNDLNIETKHPIMIVNWTNEEGSRFAPAMMASAGYAGIYDINTLLSAEDTEGNIFGNELEKIGWKGSEQVGKQKFHCYYELHIEQGPILETEEIDIGVVTHGQGLKWLEVKLSGIEQHTGTTPMHVRKDTSLAMSEIILAVNNIAIKNQPNALGSVGHIEVSPNSRNVIAGQSVFTIDFRSPDINKLEKMENELRLLAIDICKKYKVEFDMTQIGGFDPVTFDTTCLKNIRDSAKKFGYSHKDIVSGAGHDACWINSVAPSAMIMCPCVDGLSHNEAEEIKPEWAGSSTNVLLHAAIASAS